MELQMKQEQKVQQQQRENSRLMGDGGKWERGG
jgi:hypothetical protein